MTHSWVTFACPRCGRLTVGFPCTCVGSCWLDLRYAAALYAVMQIQLAGGTAYNARSISQWYLRLDILPYTWRRLWHDALGGGGFIL